MNAADIGMVQGGGGLCLALETAARRWVLIHIFWQELEGHLPCQGGIFRKVDFSHPATPEFTKDLVFACKDCARRKDWSWSFHR